MRVTAYAILIFQKICLFLGRVSLLKIATNSLLAMFDTTTAKKAGMNFILCNKLSYFLMLC